MSSLWNFAAGSLSRVEGVTSWTTENLWNVKETITSPFGRLHWLVPESVSQKYLGMKDGYNNWVVEPTKRQWENLTTYVQQEKASADAQLEAANKKIAAHAQNDPAYAAAKNPELNTDVVLERSSPFSYPQKLQDRVIDLAKIKLQELDIMRQTGSFIAFAGIASLLTGIALLNMPTIVISSVATFIGREIVAISRGIGDNLARSVSSTGELHATIAALHMHPIMLSTIEGERLLKSERETALTHLHAPEDGVDAAQRHMENFVREQEVPGCRTMIELWDKLAEDIVTNRTILGGGVQNGSFTYQAYDFFTRPVVRLA